MASRLPPYLAEANMLFPSPREFTSAPRSINSRISSTGSIGGGRGFSPSTFRGGGGMMVRRTV